MRAMKVKVGTSVVEGTDARTTQYRDIHGPRVVPGKFRIEAQLRSSPRSYLNGPSPHTSEIGPGHRT
jgi:hypothetical protein